VAQLQENLRLKHLSLASTQTRGCVAAAGANEDGVTVGFIRRAPLLLWLLPALVMAAPVGDEFQVNSYTTYDQSFPDICGDAGGDFVVVWESGSLLPGKPVEDGSRFGVFGQQLSAAGLPIGEKFQVNTYTTDYQSFPDISCAGGERFVVVWNSYGQDGSSWGVFGRRLQGQGVPASTEFQVNTYNTGTQQYPAVASAPVGNFVVAWTSGGQDGAGNGVFAQRFDLGGVPIGTEFRVNSYTTADQDYAAIAMDDQGDFIIIWVSDGQDGDELGVFGQRYAGNGLPAGSEFRVNSYATDRQDYPAVATDADGDFVVVWASVGGDGNSLGVFGRRFASDGNPLANEFRVNEYTTNAQTAPQVSMTANGDFVVVWASYGQGGDAGVFGRRFSSSGSAAGTEFRVNTSATSLQYSPAIGVNGTGDFMIVWQSLSDYTDVFGRRFSIPSATPTQIVTPRPSLTGIPFVTRTSTPLRTPTATVTSTNIPVPSATHTPSATETATPTVSPTEAATETATIEPSATSTIPPTPEPSPTPRLAGDCNGDGQVAVNELVRGVAIALSGNGIDTCTALDRDGDGSANISELVSAVNNALV
jgi:hypothetical protein